MLMGRGQPKSPQDFVREHHAKVHRVSGSELAGIFAAALFAKKTLDSTRQVEEPFPDAYVSGEQPLDDAGRAVLASYAKALEEFRPDLVGRNTTVSLMAAKGLETWVATFYAAATPDSFSQAHEIWKRLVSVEALVPEAHAFLLRRDVTDVEREYFKYRPAIFVK